MQLFREMFYLATQFARNKEICLEQILFYSFVAVNVLFSQQQKINKWKKINMVGPRLQKRCYCYDEIN